MYIRMYVVLGLLLVLGAGPAAAQARPMSLKDALELARRQSPDVQAAEARAQAALQGSRAAGAFRWPTAGLEGGAIRSDDPVAAFGGRLRQGRFTQQDFDPAFLNHPDPLTDWSGAVSAGWAPMDFRADAAYRAAKAEAEAADLGAEWAARAATFRAEARYVEAVAAEKRLGAADAAMRAAEANAHRAELRMRQGMLTEADVLQTRAALEGARARRIDVERGLADARGRLAVAIGLPDGAVPVPTDTAFESNASAQGVDLGARPDLMASEAGVRAAHARVQQAGRSRLPRVEGFARLETHGMRAFSGARRDWTVGFQLSLPLFTGFKITAMERAAAALETAAQRDHAQRLREAEAQVAEARRAVEAARQGSSAAEAAASAAEEAARLVRRRFDEGLMTTADLLGAEAQAAGLRTQAVNARLSLHIALARLAFLTDTTTEDLPGGENR